LTEQHHLRAPALEDEQRVGLAAIVVAIVAMAFGWLIDGDEDADVLGFLVAAAIVTAIGAYLFWRFVPRVKSAPGPGNRPARDGLIASGIGLLSVAVFWTGFPFVLGAAGFVLGRLGEQRSAEAGGRGLAIAAMVVGALAFALAGVVFVGDEVS
jgi:hypothetical protein